MKTKEWYFKGFTFGDWYGFCIGCILFSAFIISCLVGLYLIIIAQGIEWYSKVVGVIMILCLVDMMFFQRLR